MIAEGWRSKRGVLMCHNRKHRILYVGTIVQH